MDPWHISTNVLLFQWPAELPSMLLCSLSFVYLTLHSQASVSSPSMCPLPSLSVHRGIASFQSLLLSRSLLKLSPALKPFSTQVLHFIYQLDIFK